MRSIKAMLAVLAVAGIVGMFSGTAGADPVNAKNAVSFDLVCNNGVGTVSVVVNGNGEWTPALAETGNQVFKPYEFHLTTVFTPTGGPTRPPEIDNSVKNAPMNGRLAECSIDSTQSGPRGSVHIFGTVNGSYTPAH